MRKLAVALQGGLAVGFVVLLLLLTLVTAPSPADAQTTTTNAAVFTGRFIPAFVGAAYDPSEAFAAMAGLPVYVVSFDNWQQVPQAGQQTFFRDDLAIRTQIRADGTFQVQGVPDGNFWGVYFPFVLENDGGGEYKVKRTDCTVDSNGTPGRSTFGVLDTNPCKVQDADRFPTFYMPRPEDKVEDVFSYAARYFTSEADPAAAVRLRSQIETAPGTYEKIALEHIFITNRKDLDVDNNINTFPIVPANTLKISIKTSNEVAPGQYELRATRVSTLRQVVVGGGITRATVTRTYGNPVIKGRLAHVGSIKGALMNEYVFMAYAPRGDYVITVWRKEENSPSYSDWDGYSKLRSHRVAVMQMYVDYVDVYNQDNPTIGYAYNKDSWRTNLAFSEFVNVEKDEAWLWGLVYNERGWLYTPYWDQTGTTTDIMPVEKVYLNANNIIGCGTQHLNNLYVADPDWAPGGAMNKLLGDDRKLISATQPIATAQHVPVTRGVYIVRESRAISSGGCYAVPHSARIEVSVDTDAVNPMTNEKQLASFTSAFVDSGTIFSINGPTRKDLKVSKALNVVGTKTGVVSGGYTQGIYMRLKDAATGRELMADVKVYVINSEEDIPAESKIYITNGIGEVYIPPSDLLTSVSEGYEDLQLVLKVSDGSIARYFMVGEGSKEYPWVDLDPTSKNSAVALVCEKVHQYEGSANDPQNPLRDLSTECSDALMFSRNAPRAVPEKYNLAILNTISNMIDKDAYAAAGELSQPIPVTILDYAQLGGAEINIEIIEQRFSVLKNTKCDDCKVTLPGGRVTLVDQGQNGSGVLTASIDNANPEKTTDFSGSFDVYVPTPSSSSALAWGCRAGLFVIGGVKALILDATLNVCKGVNERVLNTRYFEIKLSTTVDDEEYIATKEVAVNEDGYAKTATPIEMNITYDCGKVASKIRGESVFNIKEKIKENVQVAVAYMGCTASQYFTSKIDSVFALIQDYGLKVAPITRNTSIIKLYDISRNIVNFLFILIFIIMAIMTILRYQPEQWHTRVILPKLLLALVFANFSILIVQAILDLNNVATATIFDFTSTILKDAVNATSSTARSAGTALAAAGGAGFVAVFSGAIVSVSAGLISFIFGTGGAGIFGIVILAASVAIAFLIQAAILALLFLMRLVIIWLLFIASPFVFLLGTTPWFSGIEGKWMNMLLKVSFIQTAVAGLLAVGLLFIIMSSGDSAGTTGMISMILIGLVSIKMAIDTPKKMMSSLGIGGSGAIASAMSANAVAGGLKTALTAAGSEAGVVANVRSGVSAKVAGLKAEHKGLGGGFKGALRMGSRRFTGKTGRVQRQVAIQSQKTKREKAQKKKVHKQLQTEFVLENPKGAEFVGAKVTNADMFVDLKNNIDTGYNMPAYEIDGKKSTETWRQLFDGQDVGEMTQKAFMKELVNIAQRKYPKDKNRAKQWVMINSLKLKKEFADPDRLEKLFKESNK